MNAIDLIKSNLTKERVEYLLNTCGCKNIREYGNCLRSTCGLHGGSNPTAFVWNLDTNLWFCHTECLTGGDIFDFVANKFDMDTSREFVKVIHKTAELLGIDLSGIDLSTIKDRNTKEARAWVKYMLNKLNKKENQSFDIKTLGTIYPINEWCGFNKEQLKEADVFYVKELNRVGFTLKDESGETVGAILRRVVSTDEPKWLNRPKNMFTGSLLYNLNNCIGLYDTVYIVEGIRDVLQLKKIGIQNVVATFGAHLSDEQVMLLMKYFTGVIILYDDDNAGFIATNKAIEKCKGKFSIYVCDLSTIAVKDPGEIIDLVQFTEMKLYRLFEWTKKE